jgi:hypothetical protein
MRRKIISFVVGIVLLAVVLVLKFVVMPMIEVERRKPHQWHEARAELRTTVVKPFLDKGLGDLVLTQTVRKSMEDCILNKSIAFLNKSDCDYYYVKTTSSRSEHEKKQLDCMKRVGFPKKIKKYTLSCALSSLPDKWAMLNRVLANILEKDLKAKIPNAKQRKKAVDCIVKKAMALLQKSSCRPLNREAKSLEKLFRPLVECLKKDEKLGKAFRETGKQCVAGATGAPAEGGAAKRGTSRKTKTGKKK